MKTYLLKFNEFVNESLYFESDNEADIAYLDAIQEMLNVSRDMIESGGELSEEAEAEFTEMIMELREFDADISELFEAGLSSGDQEDLESARKAGKRTLRNRIGQYYGWTIFFPISVGKLAYQLLRKKIQITKILKTIKDPEKKEKMRIELKDLSSRQVKAFRKMQKMKSSIGVANAAAKGKEDIKTDTPEDAKAKAAGASGGAKKAEELKKLPKADAKKAVDALKDKAEQNKEQLASLEDGIKKAKEELKAVKKKN